MKKTIRLFALMMLVLSLMLGAAIAEEAAPETAQPKFNLMDRTLVIGKNSYTFPMTIEQCKEAGLTVEEYEPLPVNKFHPMIRMDDGRRAFHAQVYNLNGVDWALGVTVKLESAGKASIGGMVLGETTKGEIESELGQDYDYLLFKAQIKWDPEYDGEGEDAKLVGLLYRCMIPEKYNQIDTTLIADEVQADPSDMRFDEYILAGKLYKAGDTIQALLDAGWILPAEYEGVQVEPNKYEMISLWGGDCFITITYSTYGAAEAKPLAECPIVTITAEADGGYASLILADGITLGSTDAEAEETFLVKKESTNSVSGLVERTYDILSAQSLDTESEDGVIVSISLKGLDM